MDFRTILMITIFGSISGDSNLKEFCSKKYFDKISVTQLKNKCLIYFRQRIDPNSSRYHLWDITVEEQPKPNYFKSSDIVYELKDSQTNRSDELFVEQHLQPSNCEILIKADPIKKELKGFPWKINGSIVSNRKYPKSAQIRYRHRKYINYISKERFRPKTYPDYPFYIETVNSDLLDDRNNTSKLYLSALICKELEKQIYVIGENGSAFGTQNRIQSVYKLSVNFDSEYNTRLPDDGIEHKEKYRYVVTTIHFNLVPINKTVFEFFGIDCKNITYDEITSTTTTTITTSSNSFTESKYLIIAVIILYIFSFGVLLLILLLSYVKKYKKISSKLTTTEMDSSTLVTEPKLEPKNQKSFTNKKTKR